MARPAGIADLSDAPGAFDARRHGTDKAHDHGPASIGEYQTIRVHGVARHGAEGGEIALLEGIDGLFIAAHRGPDRAEQEGRGTVGLVRREVLVAARMGPASPAAKTRLIST